MNTAAYARQELLRIASDDELELLGILLSDIIVATAIRDGDRKMLAKVFGVSVMSYEDRLKEQHGAEFRSWPNNFEVVEEKKVVLAIKDDPLGTCGCAVVQALMHRDETNLPSSFLAGRRARIDVEAMAETIDRGGIEIMLPQVKAAYPPTKKAVDRVQRLVPVMTTMPLPSACTADQRAVWYDYLAAVLTLYSQLRTNPAPIVVRDERITQQTHTIGDCMKGSVKADEATFRPREGLLFTARECELLEYFDLTQHEYVTEGEQQYFAKVQRDVFGYVGSEYLPMPELPVWGSRSQQPEQHNPVVRGEPTPVVSKVMPLAGEPESILRDFYGQDLNKLRDHAKLLISGGLSEEARTTYAELSKAKKAALLRAVEGPIPFRGAVAQVATALGVENTEALAEIVASKLVLARSAFKVDKKTYIVQRT